MERQRNRVVPLWPQFSKLAVTLTLYYIPLKIGILSRASSDWLNMEKIQLRDKEKTSTDLGWWISAAKGTGASPLLWRWDYNDEEWECSLYLPNAASVCASPMLSVHQGHKKSKDALVVSWDRASVGEKDYGSLLREAWTPSPWQNLEPASHSFELLMRNNQKSVIISADFPSSQICMPGKIRIREKVDRYWAESSLQNHWLWQQQIQMAMCFTLRKNPVAF